MAKIDFDIDKAHAIFAARCFNQAWKGIDAAARTSDIEEEMLSAAHASYWHWTQHPQCTAQNISVGAWQLARVYALLNQSELAKRYAQKALNVALQEPLPPFFSGYGYEALARVNKLENDHEAMKHHLAQAREHASRVESDESRALLERDLDEISQS